MNEPILGKREPSHRDYRPMTWDAFLALREWARGVAAKHQAHVYLVGSVLTKTEPRDVDLAIVLPLERFAQRFPVPEGLDLANPLHLQVWMKVLREEIEDDIGHAHAVTGGRYTVDVKLCPNTWWPEKDRLLLAAP